MDINSMVLSGDLHWPSALFARNAARPKARPILKQPKIGKISEEKQPKISKSTADNSRYAVNSQTVAKHIREDKPHFATEEDKTKRNTVPLKMVGPIVTSGGVIAAEDAVVAEDGDDVMEEAKKEGGRPASSIGPTIMTVVISAAIFIAILSWSEFIRAWFDNTFVVDEGSLTLVYGRMWYAIFITALVIIITYAIYRYMLDEWWSTD